MLTIPGKYIGKDGEEYTVLMIASDGVSGEKTVIYRKGNSGPFFTLPAALWRKGYTPAEEIALSESADASDAELVRRFTELFSGRREVCSVHWRSTFGTEGYNYLCSSHEIVPGCMFGTDSCKNCRGGRLTAFSEETARKHLNGESLIGVYPVTEEGHCRFLALELENRAQLPPLIEVCRDFGIPVYIEAFGNRLRIWFFFSQPVAAKTVQSLGCSLITAAMEKSEKITFSLYDRMSPYPADIADGSFGKPVILPLGRLKRNVSVFTDKNGVPLPKGAAEIFGFRCITKSYLADRLNALGNSGFGRLYGGVRPRTAPLSFPKKLPVSLGASIRLAKRGLPPETSAALKRMACFKNPPEPVNEFEEHSPLVAVCFSEDEKYLCFPRGLWNDLEELLKISAADYSVSDRRIDSEKAYFSFSGSLSDIQSEAVKELISHTAGILLGRTGSGKTLAVAALINDLKVSTLILTADEAARRRWTENVYRLLGADAEKNGSKIAVKLITDEKIKDKYGLVILADCSRLPMNKDIFLRVNGLSAAAVYGITADDKRRDGMWGYIHMLCGDVVYKL